MNKKIRIFWLIIALIFVTCFLCSCGSGVSSLNDSLNRLKKGDIISFTQRLAESSKDEVKSIETFYEALPDSRVDIVNDIYSHLKSTVKEGDDDNHVYLNLTYVNIQALITDLSNMLAIEGIDVVSAYGRIKNNGSLESKYITTSEMTVFIVKENGNYVIPYNQGSNPELYTSLNLLNLLRWISNV